MSDSNAPVAGKSFPTFQRFLRWLFGWNLIRCCLFVLACLLSLGALFYAEENWRGRRTEAYFRSALTAQGARLDYQTFVPPLVPDNDNFAATPFFAPLFDYLPGTQTPRDTNAWRRTMDFRKEFPDVSDQGGWRAGRKLDLQAWAAAFAEARLGGARKANPSRSNVLSRVQAAAQVLDALKQYEPVLGELREASRRPYSRFNLRYDLDNPAGILLPHLGKIRGICQILRLRSAAELAVGQIDAAASDVDLMLYLTDAVKGEPFVISQLVRIANLHLTMQIVWEGLEEHQWPEAQLRAWPTRFRQFDFIGDLKFALEAERAWGDVIIDWARNNRKAWSFEALSGPSSGNDDWQDPAAWVFRFCPRGWYDLEKHNYNRLFEQLLLSGINPSERRVAPPSTAIHNFDRLENSIQGPFHVTVLTKHVAFSRLLIPAILQIQQKFGLAQTTVDEAILACALERFRLANGAWPDKLEVLAPGVVDRIPNDVVDGKPMRYRRMDNGRFVLYSIGWNEKDEAGLFVKAKTVRAEVPDFSQGDWVWPSTAE